MTPAEHSRLLYLLDAIRVAPHRADQLFGIISERPETPSEGYREALAGLQGAATAGPHQLKIACEILRESLR